MSALNFDEILAEWSKVYLVGDYSDWKIQIDEDINKDFAAIALFLDNKTAKASGESTEFYEGFKKASFQVLDLLEILIAEEPEEKIIKITSKESTRIRDQKLAKEIWG
jgi:hypothetical protein|tara:strand:- start:269 stop:592 length:324 start_codon:yes stop_codon:yes gene_type:complete